MKAVTEMTPALAADGFARSYGCAQIVFSHFADVLGIEPALARRIAASFNGGMGRCGTCGCYTGGLMVLGARFGSCTDNDKQSRKVVARKRAAFEEAFRAAAGALNCRELLGCDTTTETGRKIFKDEKLSQKVCVPLVSRTCAILTLLLEDDAPSAGQDSQAGTAGASETFRSDGRTLR